ncbi:protein-export chaperone SecB [Paraclostridium sordellii]|uniref:Protein-export chaperone SecB n=1 Tax=Paraclostridium sordellii TaxID=1505 RepID=A0A9P1L171_PARSO|nr:protein-export chaperone SecB [Paeniclostridium sordellii]CEN31420.1 protein-export chaperone SecB [[Clostridium] sordellii] [Paeniclostridium sordellii]
MQEQINKEIYSNLVKSVEIKSIQLNYLEISDVNSDLENIDTVNIDLKFDNSKFNKLEDMLIIYSDFMLETKSNRKNETVFKMHFTYKLTYYISSLNDFDDIYINLFANRNVPVNIWPYARELISSSSSRIGLPSIVIEPLKI